MKQLIEMFYAPGAVFDYVRQRRAWAIALIANMLLVAFTVWFTYKTIGAENMARQQIENSRFTAQMTDEQKEQAIANAGTPAREGIAIGAAAIITGVVFVIFALLMMAIAGVSGGPIKFGQALGTTTYAAWPISLVRTVLSVVVVLATADRTSLDPQHLLAFNVGAFLDAHTTAKPLMALAHSLDIFVLAQVLLAAWGLARVAGITFGKALGGMIAIWVIFTLIAMGFSLVF